MPQASALPAGVYVARLVRATGTQLTKVVKE
ncbi:MAG: T9SS type A sorting domain-containing protein [Hymenobacter sp.]|nr:MAG: T9SS type A sorting domain-containing protein [Hymenobacter sp.]